MTNKKCEGIDCAWCMSIECPNEKKTEMTDKENNFAKDINVPRKEQIIIDTNKYFLEVIDEGGGTVGYTVVQPEKLLRGIIKKNKQLARKTQECEELKKELNSSEKWRINAESLNEKLDIKNTRYRKALEEIWGLTQSILDDFETYDTEMQLSYCHDISYHIQDIINKADFGKSERSETHPGESCVEPVKPPIIQEAKGGGDEDT